ncbi:uncharacterized protein LOC111345395 [Stylophora pistillata]|uniref:uncharacterized protein LOC111345395 n=1 Tax=Stylophora pistillata TaxID=50429 RepID=UPI000C042BE0|nr:uncharacterized protein LOC111345395 [Stylophora pistillata]
MESFVDRKMETAEHKSFEIRLITTEEEMQRFAIEPMAKEHWRPGLKDAECFLACDPTAALVGELNEKPIAIVRISKYGDSFAFIGAYLVDKEYRGKGYGFTIFNAAVSSVKPSCNIGLYSFLHLEKMYERSGFRTQFYAARYDFHLPTAISRLPDSLEKTSVEIKAIADVELKALLLYDTNVFGFERHAFLTKWLRSAGSQGYVAVNSEGSIVGYISARPTFLKEEGYRIGSLFADCKAIAKKLLKALFEKLLRQEKPASLVCTDSPTKCMELGEELQGAKVFDLVYMVTKDLPNTCFEKQFGVTAVELG